MSRVPGDPDSKRAFLKNLTESSLPFLIADIVYFCRGHGRVQVVDGPGDGRRDVHSYLPDGRKFVAQCKYHSDPTASVSSRETDELPIALTKFGTNSGLFATTARLSPQAKREYLDNFPNFELECLEGTDLVDLALSNPILSAVWFHNSAIEQVRHLLAIPFLLRDAQEDRPIEREHWPTFELAGLSAKIERAFLSNAQFQPYRPPSIPTMSEHGRDKISCYQLELRGVIDFHKIEEFISKFVHYLAELITRESESIVALRHGNPLLLPLVASDDPVAVPISRVEPRSYILKSGSSYQEKKWVLFQGNKNWLFPSNLSVAEAPWAGWVGTADECVFLQELRWTKFGSDDYLSTVQKKSRMEALQKSVFFAGETALCDSFLSQDLVLEEEPSIQCQYGVGGKLLAWLHPHAVDSAGTVFSYDSVSQSHKAEPTEQDATFLGKAEALKKLALTSRLSVIPYSKAKHILRAEGKDLELEPAEISIQSAEIYHYLDDYPSPIDIRKRICIYLWMWKIPARPKEARERLRSQTLHLPGDARIYWDAKRGKRTNKTFVMSTASFYPEVHETTDEFFARNESARKQCFEKIRQTILTYWPKTKVSTVEFWKKEVGFRFDGNRPKGTPYLVFTNPDGSRELRIIEEGTNPAEFWRSNRKS